MFQWTKDYAVGVQQIDREHQRLFALAESLHQAMLAGQGKAILQDLLASLVDYTCYHFAHEEQLMRRIAYPDYSQHRELHENLRSRARAMQDRAASGEITITIEVMQFLMEWLKSHTTTSDRGIAGYMKKSGRSAVGA
jgi:hemerythrin-like metal-binding protein